MAETREERELRLFVLRQKIIGQHQEQAAKDAAKERKLNRPNVWSDLPRQGCTQPLADYSGWPTLPGAVDDYYRDEKKEG